MRTARGISKMLILGIVVLGAARRLVELGLKVKK
jgi:hypothetical protein